MEYNWTFDLKDGAWEFIPAPSLIITRPVCHTPRSRPGTRDIAADVLHADILLRSQRVPIRISITVRKGDMSSRLEMNRTGRICIELLIGKMGQKNMNRASSLTFHKAAYDLSRFTSLVHVRHLGSIALISRFKKKEIPEDDYASGYAKLKRRW